MIKVLCVCLFVFAATWAYSQTAPTPDSAPQAHLSLAGLGLSYPLPNDWVRATELLRTRSESSNPPASFDILLAAVYVPKSNMSANSPFFSLRAYRQPASDCKKNLEAMIANYQDKKGQPEGGVEQFSAAGREYFRVNFAHGVGGRHQCIICTTANNHLLVWTATASNEKGLDAVLATLDSITTMPQRSAAETGQTPSPKAKELETTVSKPVVARPDRVRVSGGVTAGLLIKKVNPTYPADARSARIQGTVVLKVQINKTGDITYLELIEGPIELAGSAVAAVRQWKYRPYLLMGEPVTVETQIQVNYELR